MQLLSISNVYCQIGSQIDVVPILESNFHRRERDLECNALVVLLLNANLIVATCNLQADLFCP